MVKGRVQQIEDYVRQSMSTVTAPALRIAHDFKHVDRVRRWALRIAEKEGLEDLELVEAAVLLHDIGLAYVEVEQRSQHAQVSAETAAQFLHEQQLFTDKEIKTITDAIRWHNSPSGGGVLGEVLRDADKLDALGAVGIMRAFTSKYAKPEYDPHDVKSDTWGMAMTEFEKRFAEGKGIGDYIVDQVNFQISFYGELHTETAKRFGKPLVEFMKAYISQLDPEINKSIQCKTTGDYLMEPSLSTMWIQQRFDNLGDFFTAGEALGFKRFELGHTVRSEMFRGVQPGQQTISSIHAPCPANPGPWDYLASLDEGKRKQAVAQAKDTITLAQRFKAPFVILHMGKVAIDPSLERRLRDLYNEGRKGTQEYRDTKWRLVEARARRQAENLAAAARSLEEISQYAQAAGIRLGLENRYYYYQIPSMEEMSTLLTSSDPATVFYWHDTGHAQTLENLGFTPHEEWLKTFASRMAGVHLHDIVGLQDHRVAGSGEMNWPMIASHLPAKAIRTCEFDWPYSEKEIVFGVEYLRQMGCL